MISAITLYCYALSVSQLFYLQYIGFGSPANQSPGRRAATEADQHSYNDTDDTAAEQDQKDQLTKAVQARDMIEFGMIPEFVGRFPVIVPFHSLTLDMLATILTQPNNALLPQYEALFNMDKVRTE